MWSVTLLESISRQEYEQLTLDSVGDNEQNGNIRIFAKRNMILQSWDQYNIRRRKRINTNSVKRDIERTLHAEHEAYND